MSHEIKCAVCGKVLTPYDTKVQDGGKSYCPVCYNKNLASLHAEKSGFVPRYGVTTVKDASKLIECGHCGMVVAPGSLKADGRGKIRCPKCEKVLKPQPGVPEKIREDYSATAQLFKCLGDPCRVKIIESLSEKELCVFQFVDLTGFQYSAISYHLKLLKEMGVVKSYERGNFVVYSLTDKGTMVHEFIEKSKGLK